MPDLALVNLPRPHSDEHLFDAYSQAVTQAAQAFATVTSSWRFATNPCDVSMIFTVCSPTSPTTHQGRSPYSAARSGVAYR